MKKVLFILVNILMLEIGLFAQYIPCDTAYTVPYSPLLKKIYELKNFKGLVKLSNKDRILPFSNCTLTPNAEGIIKIDDQLYILLLLLYCILSFCFVPTYSSLIIP